MDGFEAFVLFKGWHGLFRGKKKGTSSSNMKTWLVTPPGEDLLGGGGGVRFPANIFLSKPSLLLLKPER